MPPRLKIYLGAQQGILQRVQRVLLAHRRSQHGNKVGHLLLELRVPQTLVVLLDLLVVRIQELQGLGNGGHGGSRGAHLHSDGFKGLFLDLLVGVLQALHQHVELFFDFLVFF